MMGEKIERLVALSKNGRFGRDGDGDGILNEGKKSGILNPNPGPPDYHGDIAKTPTEKLRMMSKDGNFRKFDRENFRKELEKRSAAKPKSVKDMSYEELHHEKFNTGLSPKDPRSEELRKELISRPEHKSKVDDEKAFMDTLTPQDHSYMENHEDEAADFLKKKRAEYEASKSEDDESQYTDDSGGFVGAGDPSKYTHAKLKEQYNLLKSDFGSSLTKAEQKVIDEYNRRYKK